MEAEPSTKAPEAMFCAPEVGDDEQLVKSAEQIVVEYKHVAEQRIEYMRISIARDCKAYLFESKAVWCFWVCSSWFTDIMWCYVQWPCDVLDFGL